MHSIRNTTFFVVLAYRNTLEILNTTCIYDDTYLLVKDRLGLTTKSTLLSVVSTLSLGKERSLSGLVLSNLVDSVLAALFSLAIGITGLWNVHLKAKLL